MNGHTWLVTIVFGIICGILIFTGMILSYVFHSNETIDQVVVYGGMGGILSGLALIIHSYIKDRKEKK